MVTVVFTSYNHQEYLKQALDSIVNQTYPNLEIIVVDDNSSDGSQQILRTYADNPRVSLHLLEKNTGSYVKASNYGAKFAKGEYLLFAQCDDHADPQQITKLVSSLSSDNSVGVAFSKSTLIDKDGLVYDDDFRGRELKFKKRCAVDTVITGDEMRRFLSYSCVIPNLSAAIIKKELYLKVGKLSEDYLVAADWAFWLALAEETNFYYLTTALNNFRQHETTIRSKIKIERQIVEIYSLFYAHILKYHLPFSKSIRLRCGAGLVWFSFMIENFGAGIKSFPAVLKQTFRLELLNLIFLGAGAVIFTADYFGRKIIK
ncbi:Glycosyltransferase involved in cell wall bisynthesis [Pedobacter steynii]|uniref:Glycosyltransferase involved in cell wall bisynthesis n=2 Tax=Pedobacter steynii TaxID=430522 RepID=A0A1G9WID6_9SPHI|nr:Glycosyltransferase involved in cell wall bisynthesis [Pedobacter steynii]